MTVLWSSPWTLSVLWPGSGLVLLLVCQVCVFFQPLADGSLSFTYVRVTAVFFTCDVVHSSTWCFFLDVLSLGCTTIMFMVHVDPAMLFW